VTKFNGSKLKKLKDRYNTHQLEVRAAKREDRATFRQRVTKSFEVVGNGMRIFDLAIATVYSRGKRLMWVNVALWVALVVYLWWVGR